MRGLGEVNIWRLTKEGIIKRISSFTLGNLRCNLLSFLIRVILLRNFEIFDFIRVFGVFITSDYWYLLNNLSFMAAGNL